MSRERAGQLVEAGLWLQMSGDVDGARRLFEQALKLDPQNDRAAQLARAAAPSPGGAQAAPSGPAPQPVFDMDWGAAAGFSTPAVPSVGPAAAAPVAPPVVAPVIPKVAAVAPEPYQDPPAIPLPEPESSPMLVTFEDDEDARDEQRTSAWDSHSNPGVHISQIRPGMGDAMDMVAPPAASETASPPEEEDPLREEVQTLLQGAKDLLELDDHSGAMELILKAGQLAPHDPEVTKMRERSEGVLLTMYESKLGAMEACPTVLLKDDEIIWLNLDHRAGFVLAQIDGQVRFEDLFEVCGMSRLDTARILAQLLEEGVISAG